MASRLTATDRFNDINPNHCPHTHYSQHLTGSLCPLVIKLFSPHNFVDQRSVRWKFRQFASGSECGPFDAPSDLQSVCTSTHIPAAGHHLPDHTDFLVHSVSPQSPILFSKSPATPAYIHLILFGTWLSQTPSSTYHFANLLPLFGSRIPALFVPGSSSDCCSLLACFFCQSWISCFAFCWAQDLFLHFLHSSIVFCCFHLLSVPFVFFYDFLPPVSVITLIVLSLGR